MWMLNINLKMDIICIFNWFVVLFKWVVLCDNGYWEWLKLYDLRSQIWNDIWTIVWVVHYIKTHILQQNHLTSLTT